MVRRDWLNWLYILLRFGIPVFMFFAIAVSIEAMTFNPRTDPVSLSPWFVGLVLSFFIITPLIFLAIILRVWLLFDDKSMQRKGRSYAELNGWLPFSSTHWRKVKRGNLVMSVLFASEVSRYILRIEMDDAILATDTFEAPQYAMRFADYIWENKLSHLEHVTPHHVQLVQDTWQESRAIALRQGGA